MYRRLIQLTKNNSFFLFGGRGTGKTTLIKEQFPAASTYWLDLLDPELEDRLGGTPSLLKAIVEGLPPTITHVVIDEVQKVPRLLDVVHSLIESSKKYFILTGSSARKLKYGGANLLAGRAFVYHLFPLTSRELEKDFSLLSVLTYGQLPKIFQFDRNSDKEQFLHAYTATYLKEEIFAEQLVKNLAPFRRFLEVAAQSNGKIINFATIARDVGASESTVKNYFALLEDTLVGFFLEPFNHSFRKRLSQKPKFYFFDLGVSRALAHQLQIPLQAKTYAYGNAFEHLVIAEAHRLASYSRRDYRFSYVATKDDAEIDLVVERPGKALLCIEIKSNDRVDISQFKTLISLTKDLPGCETLCLSNDPLPQQLGSVRVLPWREGLAEYFG